MKEIRQCINCLEWFLEEKLEKVSLGSHYESTYSSTPGHTSYDKTGHLCKYCLKKDNFINQ